VKPTLLILAAGIGSRYGGLKQADGVGPSGEAILDYSIYDAVKAGFGKVTFIIRKDIEEDMEKIFFSKWRKTIEIDYTFQEIDNLPGEFVPPEGRVKPWGTGHAIWVAKDMVKEPFAVINADDFYGRESYQLAFDFLSNLDNLLHSRYALIGYVLKNTLSDHGHVSRAECETDDNNLLTSITERLKIQRAPQGPEYEENGKKVPIGEDTLVSMNMWCFMPSLFQYLEEDLYKFLETGSKELKAEFLLPDVIDRLIKSEIVEIPVLKTGEKWFGMTYKEDKPEVRDKIAGLVKEGTYPTPIW
jgi:UTP-glucose-1-phosphate uridylyltransferase